MGSVRHLKMDKIYIYKAIVFPFIMVLDYYLTVYSDHLRKKGHSRHYQLENYELNPIWVKDINKRKLFNPKHLSLVIIFSLFIWYFLCRPEVDSNYNRLLYGAIVTIYFMIIGRHTSNILLYKFTINNPHELNGRITLSTKYIYIASAYQYFVCFGAILPLAILSSSYYVYGGLIGSIVLISIHLIWYRKHSKNMATVPNKANSADAKSRAAD
jgi:hypothetical protein